MKLIIDELVAVRGGRTILHGVSFTVAAGEALVLTGPNAGLLNSGLSDAAGQFSMTYTSSLAGMDRLRGAFNVSESGQKAAVAALGDQQFVLRSRDHNARELARFSDAMAALGNHGIRPLPSKANFVLVLFDGALSAAAALQVLGEAGYAVRHLPGQGLPHGLRITIGTARQMDDIARIIGEAAEMAG